MRLKFALAIVATIVVSLSAFAQRVPPSAAKTWMTEPVDLRTQTDSVPPDDRKARDAYWDRVIGSPVSLSNANAGLRPLPHVFVVPTAPEFGDLGDGAWVIGKFESYQTILSQSQLSIYTEIGLRIQHVFGHPIPPVQDGQLITLDRPGGTVIAPSGKLLSFPIDPDSMGLQPNHSYLVLLGYDESGHYYRAAYKAAALWDVTDGSVKPGNNFQRSRANNGLSEINGMDVDRLSRFLDDKFKKFYEAGGRSR